MTQKLAGKVAVITGGNSGIGLATAQRFAAEGAYVFITGRRQNELDAAVRQIGKNVAAVQGDVSNLADLDRLYATVERQKGRIDVLFANAGIAELAPLGAITEEHFDKTFNINAISPGPIETPGLNRYFASAEGQAVKTRLVAGVPMGRMGSPDEIAKAALFLASDDSSYITGIELFVDGGVAQI